MNRKKKKLLNDNDNDTDNGGNIGHAHNTLHTTMTNTYEMKSVNEDITKLSAIQSATTPVMESHIINDGDVILRKCR